MSEKNFPLFVTKNSGHVEDFDMSKITAAAEKALREVGAPEQLAYDVTCDAETNVRTLPSNAHVSDIHNVVERSLMKVNFDAGRAYISHRDSKRKELGRPITPEVRRAFDAAETYFPTAIQQFQYFDKYSRFDHLLDRRETWPETVERSVSYLAELAGGAVSKKDISRIRNGILNMRVMPSMRLMAMAGEAARRNNISIYNCSYNVVDNPYVFVESLIISMSGCGVGYSVERQFVDKLPVVGGQEWAPELDSLGNKVWTCRGLIGDDTNRYTVSFGEDPHNNETIWFVEDSAEGWAKAVLAGVTHWFYGLDTITFDVSGVRRAGAVLKTKGGTASGPGPLTRLLDFAREMILSCKGRRLTTTQAHDLMCVVADCAVQGGTRRAACISLFSWDDQEMRMCKSGNWWKDYGYRKNANNSCVWPDRPLSEPELVQFFMDMHNSGAGEPGICARANNIRTMPERRRKLMRAEHLRSLGVNPCSEIFLRAMQFCNLSIAVARPGASLDELREQVELATIIGTIQAKATHFPGLRTQWRENCEEERLLGVDITGQADVDYLSAEVLSEMKELSIRVNKKYAKKLGIAESTSITCVKPSGNSSVLLNCSPGLNRRWSPYQIRRTRLSAHGVLAKVLKLAGMRLTPENGETEENVTTYVASWPMRTSNENIPTTRERCALDQLEAWRLNKVNYVEHNPSITVTYRPDEVIDIINWLREYQSIIGGISFLPADDSVYEQMPNEAITKEQYEEMLAKLPTVDYALLYALEEQDTTTAAQELACSAGGCLI